jgi:mono/diheme cytochrome c family protein
MKLLPRIILAAALTVGCNQSPFPDVDLERMINQKRYSSYQASEFFKDGRAMRSPPPDTVAHDRITGDPALSTGLVDGGYIDRIPVDVTRDVVDRGRTRFEVFCAACHGIAGDGDSLVAANMQLKRPPSLVSSEVEAFPAGRIFQIVSQGYGLMRPYSDCLTVDERWAVIWYLRALQLRSGVSLDRLPLALRNRAEKELSP